MAIKVYFVKLVRLVKSACWSIVGSDGGAPLRRGRSLFDGRSDYPKGVPLQVYVDSGAELKVQCEVCRLERLYSTARLIQVFKARGRGKGNTGVNETANSIRGARTCGA